MEAFSKLLETLIEEWQNLSDEDRNSVLNSLNVHKHEFTTTTKELRNAYATAAYILAELSRI